MKKRWFIIFGVAAALIAAATVLILYWKGYILPAWITWQEKEILCSEQDEPQKILLRDKKISVFLEDTVVWQSDAEVSVQDALWCDIDHDDQKELLLLCWRRGRYGKSRPFWVKEDPKIWSQHIFIYDWTQKQLRPIWMASDIGVEAACWSFDEERRLLITDRDGVLSAWDWESWGLSSIPLRQQLSFGAVGDNLIHRQIYDYAFRHFDGCFDDLFAYVKEELDIYDVTSINQETIYVDKPEQYSSYPVFGTPVEVGEAVINAGFDIVSCATNHTLDKGIEAIDLTAELYETAGVICAGIQSSEDEAYRPYEILEQNGLRCAIFAYTLSTNGMSVPEETPFVLHRLEDPQQVKADLMAGSADADVCIVYVHWGTEYAEQPDETQRAWAKVFADSGAHVVIGTHPHVLQPFEWVTGENGHKTLVYYSLGNFISAQTEENCRIGGLAYFTVVKEDGTVSVKDYGLKQLYTQWENGHYYTSLKQ